MPKYYTEPAEHWSRAQCEALSKRKTRDGCGTLWPYKGLVQGSSTPYPRYGRHTWNGGIVKDGEWWQGIDIPWPVTPWPWVICFISSWGYFIRKIDDVAADWKVWTPHGFKPKALALPYIQPKYDAGHQHS